MVLPLKATCTLPQLPPPRRNKSAAATPKAADFPRPRRPETNKGLELLVLMDVVTEGYQGIGLREKYRKTNLFFMGK
jgi:hypothetical protein